jgi:hypothetical protein
MRETDPNPEYNRAADAMHKSTKATIKTLLSQCAMAAGRKVPAIPGESCCVEASHPCCAFRPTEESLRLFGGSFG